MKSACEQIVNLKEINEAAITIKKGTQQNAAMVEESTAARHSLANEVDALNRLLSTSKTGEPPRTVSSAKRHDAAPAVSPVRNMPQKNARAFAANGNAAIAQSADSWEEFRE